LTCEVVGAASLGKDAPSHRSLLQPPMEAARVVTRELPGLARPRGAGQVHQPASFTVVPDLPALTRATRCWCWTTRHQVLVLELAGAGDVESLMRRRQGGRPLPEPLARHLTGQLLRALAHSHARALVHRDVKCVLAGVRARVFVRGVCLFVLGSSGGRECAP
jgi:serine/threonine protein kinase